MRVGEIARYITIEGRLPPLTLETGSATVRSLCTTERADLDSFALPGRPLNLRLYKP
jgi:hypothetical protein